MPATDSQLLSLQQFVRDQMLGLEMVPLDRTLSKELGEGSDTLIASLRRRGGRRPRDPITSFSVVEDDGVVRFVPGGFFPYASGRRGRLGTPSGQKVDDFKFEDLEPNKVQEFLEATDDLIRKRNSEHAGMGEQEFGLREWDPSTKRHRPVDPEKQKAQGRILLIVHGFISSTNHLLTEMLSIDVAGKKPGEQFLNDLVNSGKYKQILTFDHKTVSVSPVLNALDLHEELHKSLGPTARGRNAPTIDVICHSRGGLVTRWWLEGLRGLSGDERPSRVIFLGSPLAGTSLAAPAHLRGVMDLFASIGSFFSHAANAGAEVVPFAAPFMVLAGALFRVFSYVTKTVAKTPVIDAGINMAAGISGMSRVGNNSELSRLRQYPRPPIPEYFAVKSNFRPPDEGWRFWRYFYNVGDRVKNLFMDQIFHEENDLIVNTASMTQLGPLVPGPGEQNIEDGGGVKRVLDYRTTGTVHHTNYFRQKETIEFFADSLLR